MDRPRHVSERSFSLDRRLFQSPSISGERFRRAATVHAAGKLSRKIGESTGLLSRHCHGNSRTPAAAFFHVLIEFLLRCAPPNPKRVAAPPVSSAPVFGKIDFLWVLHIRRKTPEASTEPLLCWLKAFTLLFVRNGNAVWLRLLAGEKRAPICRRRYATELPRVLFQRRARRPNFSALSY
jgi:hypothetical protein